MKRYFKLLIICIMIFVIYKIYIFLSIDNCLDDGNVWDYHNSICVKEQLSIDAIKCFSKKGNLNKTNNTCSEE